MPRQNRQRPFANADRQNRQGQFNNALNPVVGIDLGTTYSCSAHWDGRNPEIYANLDQIENKSEIPSVVYREEGDSIAKGDNIIVGSVAYKRYLIDPANGVVEIKREMGNGDYRVTLRGQPYTPVEISALILRKIRDEIYGRFPAGVFDFGGVVMTHPFHFKGPQIEDTAKAAEQAGLNLLGLVPEPVAAALAYALHALQGHLTPGRPETILVFDLGGGTFDTTLFELYETAEKLVFKGLSTGGDTKLGGMDFNRALMDYALQKVAQKIDLNLERLDDRERIHATAVLQHAVDVLKRDLSVLEQSRLIVPNILPGKHINEEIRRAEFEDILHGKAGGRDFYKDIQKIMQNTLVNGGISSSRVDRILLVGGSTRIPLLKQQLLPEILPYAQIYSNLPESLVVAMGAALYAAYLDHRLTYDKEIDILPPGYAHNLGLRTHDGRFAKIIRSNTPLPAKSSQVFITPEDDCKVLSLEVYEGEGERIAEALQCGTMMQRGRVVVHSLPPHRKGEIEISVRFTVARSEQIGVHVEVYHTKNGKREKIRDIDEDLKRDT